MTCGLVHASYRLAGCKTDFLCTLSGGLRPKHHTYLAWEEIVIPMVSVGKHGNICLSVKQLRNQEKPCEF